MSTSIAISTAANTSAVIAQQQAERAMKLACEAMMPTYTHQTATVEQMQVYAKCVEKLHPEELSFGAVIALKIAIVIVLLSTAVGGYIGSRGYDGTLYGAFVGCFGSMVALFLLFLLLAALHFLFS